MQKIKRKKELDVDYFNLKFHNTSIKNEIFEGIAMFMAMSYILVVNPTILSTTCMDYKGVFLATVCVSGFTTIVSAFYTKLPIALAPGLGMASIFASLATGENPTQWQVLLLATYVAGIVICAFVRFSVYDKIMQIVDDDFRGMTMSGIGCALLLYGISTLGILEKKDGIYVFGKLEWIPIGITVLSLLVIYIMKRCGKKGFVLAGLVLAYVLSAFANYMIEYSATGVGLAEYFSKMFSFYYEASDITNVMFAFPNISEIIYDNNVLIQFINAVFIFTMGHFFDAIGTNMSAFDAINSGIDHRMKETVSLKRVITVDGVGNVVSGLFGTSTVTSYGESLVGIVSGGKTGITALTTGCLFLLCFFFSPLFMLMTTYVAAPALIYVGLELVLRYRSFDRSNRKIIFIFGLLMIGYIGITFNIGNAVLFGLVIYTILKWTIEKKKPVSFWWIMCVFVAIKIVLGIIA